MSYQSAARSQGTTQNIQMIQNSLNPDAKTVLDIGCNEGVLTAHLENLGLEAKGIEGSQRAIQDGYNFLTTNQSKVVIEHKLLTLEDIKKLPEYDVIIFNSVHHQLVKNNGLEYANNFLTELAKKAKLQLYFQPCTIHLKHGIKMPFIENDMKGIVNYYQNIISNVVPEINHQLLGFSDNKIPPQEPLRPLILFSKTKNNSGIQIPYSTEKNNQSRLMYVDIDHCVSTRDMQSYNMRNGWHHKVSACLDIIKALSSKDQSLTIENMDIYHYYKSIAPNTFGQVWNKHERNSDIGFFTSMPTRNYCFWVPWRDTEDTDENIRNGITQAPEIPSWDMSFYGPKSDQEITKIIERLHDLIIKINREGYMPQVNYDGYIRGSILRRGSEYRFALSAGQHRTAVLAALGYEQILVKLTGSDICVKDAESWPLVKRGIYTTEEAINIFNGFFDCSGKGMHPSGIHK